MVAGRPAKTQHLPGRPPSLPARSAPSSCLSSASSPASHFWLSSKPSLVRQANASKSAKPKLLIQSANSASKIPAPNRSSPHRTPGLLKIARQASMRCAEPATESAKPKAMRDGARPSNATRILALAHCLLLSSFVPRLRTWKPFPKGRHVQKDPFRSGKPCFLGHSRFSFWRSLQRCLASAALQPARRRSLRSSSSSFWSCSSSASSLAACEEEARYKVASISARCVERAQPDRPTHSRIGNNGDREPSGISPV